MVRTQMGISGRECMKVVSKVEGRMQMLWEQYPSTYMGPETLTDLDILGEIRHLSSVNSLIHL